MTSTLTHVAAVAAGFALFVAICNGFPTGRGFKSGYIALTAGITAAVIIAAIRSFD